jgi:hypothetical protein
MRKKAHSVGDTIYLNGVKGRVSAVDPTSGKATVHSQKTGELLGSAPAYGELPVRPADFKWADVLPSGESLTVVRDDYIDRDFDADPIRAEDGFKRSQAQSLLSNFRADYFKAQASGDKEDLELAKKAIEYQAKVVGDVDLEAVFNGVCGIDGCGYASKGGFEPDHFAMSGCRSGRRNHCTCDGCF